jgi:hypothetical protein
MAVRRRLIAARRVELIQRLRAAVKAVEAELEVATIRQSWVEL